MTRRPHPREQRRFYVLHSIRSLLRKHLWLAPLLWLLLVAR
jgi:hypothetical protein